MQSSIKLKAQVLKQEIELLSKQYIETSTKAIKMLDPGGKVLLEEQAIEILETIDIKEDELLSLQDNTNKQKQKQNQAYLEINTKLTKFDFNQTIAQVETILDEFDIQNGMVLFLLENDYDNGFEFLVPRLSELLKSRCLNKINFLHRLVEFTCNLEDYEEYLLDKLAEYFLPQFQYQNVTIEEYRRDIVNAICNHIPHSGYILFMEISGLDCFGERQYEFLDLFVSNFWQQLIAQLNSVLTDKEIEMTRVICLLRTDGEIIKDSESCDLYCQDDNFTPKQIVQLRVEPCKQDEIKSFLYAAGLNKTKVNKCLNRINQFAKHGEPRRVCVKLDQILG